MARPVVGNPFENQIPTVSPTASPVETYVRPAVKKSPFEALANTLNNLERKASPIFAAEEKRRAEKEFAEGQALWDDTRKQFGDAVRQGIIAEGESPYVRKGYRVSNLSSLSAQYASELKNELDRKKLYTNGNPAAIAAFTEKFKEEFKQKYGVGDDYTPTEVAQYFLPTTARADQAFAESWKSKNVQYMTAKAYEGVQNKVAAYTYSIVDPKLTPEQRTANANGLLEFIQGVASESELDGLNRSKVGKSIGDALRLVALQTNDTTPLELMAHVQLGTAPLGATYENQVKNLDVMLKIADVKEQQREDAIQAVQAKIDTTSNSAFSTASAALANLADEDAGVRASASQEIDKQVNILNSLGDEDASKLANSLLSLRQSAKERFKKNDPQVIRDYAEYMSRIEQAPNKAKANQIIAEALDAGVFTQPAHFNKAMEAANSRVGTPVYKILEDSTGPVQPLLDDVYSSYFAIADSPVSQLQAAERLELRQTHGLVVADVKAKVRQSISKFKAENQGAMPDEDAIYDLATVAVQSAVRKFALDKLAERQGIGRKAIANNMTNGSGYNLSLTPTPEDLAAAAGNSGSSPVSVQTEVIAPQTEVNKTLTPAEIEQSISDIPSD